MTNRIYDFIPNRTPDSVTEEWDLALDDRVLVTDFDGTLFRMHRIERDGTNVRYFGAKVSKKSGKTLTDSTWEIFGPMPYPEGAP